MFMRSLRGQGMPVRWRSPMRIASTCGSARVDGFTRRRLSVLRDSSSSSKPVGYSGSSTSTSLSPCPERTSTTSRAESLVPKLLVVLMLPKDPGEWLDVDEERMIVRRSAYWASLAGYPSTSNATKVSVRMPRSQRFTVDQLQDLMKRVSRRRPYELDPQTAREHGGGTSAD